jgi:hypothetical protein
MFWKIEQIDLPSGHHGLYIVVLDAQRLIEREISHGSPQTPLKKKPVALGGPPQAKSCTVRA